MIVEMRTYRIKPGLRAEFLEIFRTRSLPAHQQIGMKIRCPFLSVEDPDVFFFMRGRRGGGRSRVLAVGREAHGGRPQASSLSTRKP